VKITKFLGFILISLFSAYCFPQTEKISKSTFEPLYAKLKVVMADRDEKGILGMLAPDFQSEDASGNVTNSEKMVSSLSKLLKDPNKTSTTTILEVTAKGKNAFVKQKYQMNTIKLGADGSSKKAELVSVSNDTWEFTNGKWLLLKTVTQEMQYTLDGKEVNHQLHK
jgi:hypothetical protein